MDGTWGVERIPTAAFEAGAETDRTKNCAAIPLPEFDRRTDARNSLSVYRAAVLHRSDSDGLCLVRNLSPGGLMGKVYADLAVGEAVSLEIEEGHPIAGMVVWVNAPLVGIQFAERVDVPEILHPHDMDAKKRPHRMPRVRVDCIASMLVANNHQRVTLVDLSQGCAKIEDDFLAVGDNVVLTIKGLEAHRGVVRWTHDGYAGIAFANPIDFDRLSHWSFERQTEAHGSHHETGAPHAHAR